MTGSLYVEVIEDPFSAKIAGEQKLLSKNNDRSSASKETNHVRRPTRGLVIKDDTFACLRVVSRKSGKSLLLVDAGSNIKGEGGNILDQAGIDGESMRSTDVYSNFILQSVQEERVEKSQILETFGEPYIFFFGERAKVINFSGVLVNSNDFNWEAEWWYNYDTMLRGTRCVENDARIYLSYDDTLVSGYMMMSSAVKDTNNPRHVNFQFQLFISSYTTLSDLGDPNAYFGNVKPALSNKGVNLDKISEFAFYSTDELNAMRPKLVPFSIPIGPDGIKVSRGADGRLNGNVAQISLIGSLEEKFQFVQDSISTISNYINKTNNLISGLSGLVNGDRVRVPVGFAGSLEYDEGTPRLDLQMKYENAITFTTFADNVDEYVGSGDQYSTSTASLDRSSVLSKLGDGSLEKELTYGDAMIKKATGIWERNGVHIMQNELGPISRRILSRGLGLLGIGASYAVQGVSGIPEIASQAFAKAANFAVPLSRPATVAANTRLLAEAPNAAIRFANAVPEAAKQFVE